MWRELDEHGLRTSTPRPARHHSALRFLPTAEPMPAHTCHAETEVEFEPAQPVVHRRFDDVVPVLFDSTISDTITACFGYFFFTAAISQIDFERAVGDEPMFLKPTMRWPPTSSYPQPARGVDDRGSPSVFHTAPPSRSLRNAMTWSPVFVGVALAARRVRALDARESWTIRHGIGPRWNRRVLTGIHHGSRAALG